MALYAPPNPTLVQSGTFNANPLTMAAGLAAMRLLDQEAVDRLDALGARFSEGLRVLAADAPVPATVTGMGSLWTMHFTSGEVVDYRSKAAADPRVQRDFHLALLTEGVFSAPRGMFALSTVMSDDEIDEALAAISRALRAL
jgi:glutamate-1-semialdehyde 2,1-aminomutase